MGVDDADNDELVGVDDADNDELNSSQDFVECIARYLYNPNPEDFQSMWNICRRCQCDSHMQPKLHANRFWRQSTSKQLQQYNPWDSKSYLGFNHNCYGFPTKSGLRVPRHDKNPTCFVHGQH